MTGGLPESLPARGSITCVTDPIRITPGRCYTNLALYKSGGMADHVESAAYFDVESENIYGHGTIPERQWVLTVIGQEWNVKATRELIDQVEGLLGRDSVQIIYGAPPSVRVAAY